MRNRFLLIVSVSLLAFFPRLSVATHLMGGSLTYLYQGMSGPDFQYKVTLKIYRYCDATGGGTAPLDFSMMLGIYDQDPLNPNDDKWWNRTEILNMVSSGFITPPSPGINCPFNTTVCVEEGIYEADILLPPSAGGYHLLVERCCRNGNIVNLSSPGSFGQTYYCFIPPAPVVNSSPQFSDVPVPYICAGDQVTIVNNAWDPDGDSLVYSFEIPYSGYSGAGNAVPDPQIDNNPYGWPIPGAIYNPGYSVNLPFGAGGLSQIDSYTGLTTYTIPNQGFFVVVVEIKEYRNGVLIAAVRRDLQLIAIPCPVNVVPILSNAGGAGQVNFTITEGQTLCFPVAFSDPDGDSLFLTSTGNIFNGILTNPPATLPAANGDGFVTSQFCWSTDCGMASAAPYQFVASVRDNGCPPKTINQIYSIIVNPSPLPPAPAISIMQNPPGPICLGTLVTFTALPTFGGTSPVFQWQLNGVNVGGNSNTWISSSLNNGDVITVSMISNSACVNTFTATSAPVVMVVNPFVAPSVTIVAVPAGPICAGTAVTFTANPVNPGPAPVYQWTVNGVNAGNNSPVFNTSTLSMGSQVGVILSSNPACPASTSNNINITVNPTLTPSVQILSNISGAICPGQAVTFQAYPVAGGSAPSYQWQVNGINVGSNSNLFTTSTLNSGDQVSVILNSSEICVTTASANSNVITITVTAPTSPSVSISANPAGPVCKDDNIIFTATPVNGGASPVYQWQVNGVTVFTGGNIFATSTLNNGDQVKVVLTSSLSCLTTTSATSNILQVTVNPLSVPSVAISISPSPIFCAGTQITFTATPVNGGTAPSYVWQINGVNTGATGSTYSTNSLVNQDKVRVVLTSSANCTSPLTANSNQITVSVLPIVVPSVSLTANPSGPICQGTSVTFTAAPVVGGLSPGYQWQINGVSVPGATSPSFTSSNLNNGDIVRVWLTSSANCASPLSVVSPNIPMVVNPILVPSASVAVIPSFPVCEGTPVTFNAAVTNEGSTPFYQWQVNGVTVAWGSLTFTTSSLNDGDSIRLRMTSNALCVLPAVVISNTIGATITPLLAPVVSIAAAPGGAVCAGTSVTYTANAINGGTSPSFQWFLNGIVTGTGSNTYTGTFNHQDTILVVMTSSYNCPLPPIDTSNVIITNVLPNLTPSVSLVVNPAGPVCPGDLLTFTATPVNGGGAPVYQWFFNGSVVPNTGPSFSGTTFQDGDQISVQLTSSGQCLTVATITSNTIQAIISPNIQPGVAISVQPQGPVCDGDTLFFNSFISGGGTTPAFSWRVNGIPVGSTLSNFNTNQLNNGDVVDLILTSSAFCALPLTDTSNTLVAVIDPLLSPTAIITANPPGIFCDGTIITYSAVGTDGGTTPQYNWLLNGAPLGINNDTVITGNFQNGDSLLLLFTSSERCLNYNPALSNLIIIERYPPLLPLMSATPSVCEGEEALLSVQITGGNGGPYYLEWSNGLGNESSYVIHPVQSATYFVTVSDSCSTEKTEQANIVVNLLPDVDFMVNPSNSNILNPYFEFEEMTTGASQWIWDFGDGATSAIPNPIHEYNTPGYYRVWLTAVSDSGCIDSTFRDLTVSDVVTFYIPNSFTPDGDGINDQFGIIGNSMSGYQMLIYNRWGQPIFESKGPFDTWDGNGPDGSLAPVGVYVYRAKIFNAPGKQIYNGTVTLLR